MSVSQRDLHDRNLKLKLLIGIQPLLIVLFILRVFSTVTCQNAVHQKGLSFNLSDQRDSIVNGFPACCLFILDFLSQLTLFSRELHISVCDLLHQSCVE